MPDTIEEVEGVHTYGDNEDNVLYDSYYNDFIYGYGGNDRVVAHSNSDAPTGDLAFNLDRFYGGSGSDTIDYHAITLPPGYSSISVEVDLADSRGSRIIDGQESNRDALLSFENVIGSDGDDDIRGDNGANRLEGGDGDDLLLGRGGNDSLYGGDGADYAYGGTENDMIYGGNDGDHLYGENGNDHVYGENGNDWVLGQAGNDFLDGGHGEDTVYGGSGHDTINGGRHDDLIYGHAGNDHINGGRGDDTLNGGDGWDTLVHTGGTAMNVSLLDGTASNVFGTDTISNFENVSTGGGSDLIGGTFEANVIQSGGGNDTIIGFSGNNVIYGGSGEDYVLAGLDNDIVLGQSGEDLVYGQNGSDTIVGGSGADDLYGGDDDDVIRGDSGNDLIVGGEGVDNVKGGWGSDVFRWEDGDLGTDVILDFSMAFDKISFGEDFFAWDPGIGGNYAGLLMTFAAPGAGMSSYLFANTQEAGWQNIGWFQNVHVNSLQQGVFNGSIFAAEVNPVVVPDWDEFIIV